MKINADNLPVVELGASGEEKIGNYAAALGSSMILEQAEASIGAISSTDYTVQTSERIFTDQFQTDAKIVAKNSGGPVIGIDGKVIGMAYYLRAVGISIRSCGGTRCIRKLNCCIHADNIMK